MVRPVLAAAIGLVFAGSAYAADVTLLNVSYDPTRELYQRLNTAFAADWKRRPAKTSRSSSRMAAPASRRAR